MAHILKLSEWECNEKWYVGDIESLGTGSGTWWYVSNLLGITPKEYVELLINKFHAINVRYSVSSDVLIYAFATQAAARTFKNYINKLARQTNCIIADM